MKKLILTLALCLIALPIFANEITDDYIDIAKNYLNNENTKKAQEYVNLVLLLDPNNEKALSFKKLTTQEKDGINSNLTVEVKETVLSMSSKDKSAELNNKGVDSFKEENIENAVKYFKQAISCKKNNCVAYYNLALCYKMQGKTLLAEYNFKRAYFINKNFLQCLIGIADMKNGAEKLKYLNRAAENKSFEAFYLLGEYYFEQENYTLALKNYSEALILEPNLADAYLKAAQCCYNQEDYELAGINLKKYMTYIPDNDFAHFLLAKTYRHLGYDTNALQELNTTISINSKDEYLFELAKVCYWDQNYDISIYILNKLIKENSKNSNYYNQLGLCYYENGNINLAKENFNKALELDDKSATIYFNLSKCDKDNAEKYLQQAEQIVPQSPKQAIDLAIMYYKISQNQKALDTINEAVEIYGCDNKDVYKAKMRLCKLIGNFNEYEKTKAELAMRFGAK